NDLQQATSRGAEIRPLDEVDRHHGERRGGRGVATREPEGRPDRSRPPDQLLPGFSDSRPEHEGRAPEPPPAARGGAAGKEQDGGGDEDAPRAAEVDLARELDGAGRGGVQNDVAQGGLAGEDARGEDPRGHQEDEGRTAEAERAPGVGGER